MVAASIAGPCLADASRVAVAIVAKSGDNFFCSIGHDMLDKVTSEKRHGAPPRFICLFWVTFWPGRVHARDGDPRMESTTRTRYAFFARLADAILACI